MIVVLCYMCKRTVTASRVDDPNLCDRIHMRYDNHWDSMVGVSCRAVGTDVAPSLIPSWHDAHVCGFFCDGQDGMFSECAQAKRAGPPSAVDQLAALETVEHSAMMPGRTRTR